jgi:hypothetical protein
MKDPLLIRHQVFGGQIAGTPARSLLRRRRRDLPHLRLPKASPQGEQA